MAEGGELRRAKDVPHAPHPEEHQGSRAQDIGPDIKRMRDYVYGRLPEAEHRAFEEQMECDPVLVQEVEHLLRFREGLQVVSSQGYLQQIAKQRRRTWSWVGALAAAALAGIALLLWQQRPADGGVLSAYVPADSAGVRLPVAAEYRLLVTRGSTAWSISLPPRGLIKFDIPVSGGSRFKATLLRTEDDPARNIGTVSGLRPDAEGVVHAYADASWLNPGSYALQLESDAGERQRIPLRLTMP